MCFIPFHFICRFTIVNWYPGIGERELITNLTTEHLFILIFFLFGAPKVEYSAFVEVYFKPEQLLVKA